MEESTTSAAAAAPSDSTTTATTTTTSTPPERVTVAAAKGEEAEKNPAHHLPWELYVDGSVRPYNSSLNPEVDGGFAGCAWVLLDPFTGKKAIAMGYPMPLTHDVASTELMGILKAFQFVDGLTQSSPDRDFTGLNVTVYSDCRDAIDEVRYAFAPADGPIPLSGQRVGWTDSQAHPDLSNGILEAIRSLESRGIVARLMWMPRMSSYGSVEADSHARRAAEMRKRFAGLNCPKEFRLY